VIPAPKVWQDPLFQHPGECQQRTGALHQLQVRGSGSSTQGLARSSSSPPWRMSAEDRSHTSTTTTSRWQWFQHSRFDMILCFTTLEEVSRKQELYINYKYSRWQCILAIRLDSIILCVCILGTILLRPPAGTKWPGPPIRRYNMRINFI
jgi:hypothetical protein